jgi:hypothetical protein
MAHCQFNDFTESEWVILHERAHIFGRTRLFLEREHIRRFVTLTAPTDNLSPNVFPDRIRHRQCPPPHQNGIRDLLEHLVSDFGVFQATGHDSNSDTSLNLCQINFAAEISRRNRSLHRRHEFAVREVLVPAHALARGGPYGS